MTDNEKDSLWEGISKQTFLKEENLVVRKPILSRLYYRGLLPAISQQSISFGKKKYALGLIGGTLIVTGGLSAFAEMALPGDLLYPVKTKVTEQVQVALLSTPEEKATAEAILATKRLEEIETLALTGKLDQLKAELAAEDFNSHVHKFEQHLDELQANKEFSVVTRIGIFFQTRIAVHAAVLKDMNLNNTITNKQTVGASLSAVVVPLQKKVLEAMVPIAIVTEKALTITMPNVTKVATIKNTTTTEKQPVALYIDTKEAKSYLQKLHEDVGTPAPILDATLTNIAPVRIP